MHHRLARFHSHNHPWNYLWAEAALALCLAFALLAAPTSALRFQDRSLYMDSTLPGATADYTVKFRYMSPDPVGSVDLLFCVDPIPHHACVTPPGLDVSNASLSQQAGELGFVISNRSTNHIVLTRASVAPAPGGLLSSYTFANIKNPTDSSQSFSIRLRSHSTPDASGTQIDFGSVKGQVTEGVEIATQVPPMLIFCVAEEVSEDCATTNDNNYSDMGELSPSSTLMAQSQMAVGTNASGGFAITANGLPFSAGTSIIDGPMVPTESRQGVNQFGINLVENDLPDVGEDPEGTWANAVVSPDYAIPNRFKYVPGDVVAYSPNVSLMKKYTVSYILNSHKDLRAGVYSTTVTYIASGRF